MRNLVGVFARLAVISAITFQAGLAIAMDIQQVKSPGGIQALLVEDYTLPLVAISISFAGGAAQDRPGKEGTVRLMTALLDEGAGGLDSQAYQGKMESLGLEMGFSTSRDSSSASLRTLKSNLEPALELLKLALYQPRFDEEAIERIRDSLKAGIARGETNPSAVAGRALRQTLFANHPYGRSVSGTIQSIDSVMRADLLAMHRNLIVKQGLHIGVVGAIDAGQLSGYLDDVFASLPDRSDWIEVSEVEPNTGEQVTVDMSSPNATISLVYPGIKRDHPDYFAAYLLNHILGGGGFSSRLYNEVREKRGLAYGVWSDIVSLDRTSYLITGTSTRAENTEGTLSVIRDQVSDIASGGVTPEELAAAKKYVIGSYAIKYLDTSSRIAAVLVALQSEDLGLDYLTRREHEINDVTLEQVNSLARELLSVEPTVVIVGPGRG